MTMNPSTQPPAAGEAAHTPTPWRISAAGNIRPDDGTKAGKVIASTQSEQDAAFIVRACNSYAALVEALADILPRYEALIRDGDNGNGRPLASETVSIERATAALAAAKEGQQ